MNWCEQLIKRTYLHVLQMIMWNTMEKVWMYPAPRHPPPPPHTLSGILVFIDIKTSYIYIQVHTIFFLSSIKKDLQRLSGQLWVFGFGLLLWTIQLMIDCIAILPPPPLHPHPTQKLVIMHFVMYSLYQQNINYKPVYIC